MTVKELIEELKKLDQNTKVYRSGGQHLDDYTPIGKVLKFKFWGDEGYEIR